MARILHVLPAFLPANAWGGPVVSTAAMCRAAAVSVTHEVKVLTTDAKSPETRKSLILSANPVDFPEGYQVHYAHRRFGQSGSWELLRKLPKMVAWADLVHLSMTYSFPTLPTLTACKLLNRPVVWSPRGAIQATEEWEHAPRKRAKTAFEKVARALLPRRAVLHVTAETEARATARRMNGVPVEVIPNSVSVAKELPRRAFRENGRLQLLFLSRLHPKKGLEMLLEVMADMPEHITLSVAGSGSRDFETLLFHIVQRLGLDSRVTFLGHVEGQAKANALAEADAFVLPTQSENFGIAIAEALASGLPVITTRAAPWELIEVRKCGYWIEAGSKNLANAIRAMDSLSADELAQMGRRGHAWMASDFSEVAVGKRLLDLYAAVLEK